jgi:hypothetical protein
MTPEVQREAMAVLAEVWALSPDVRLGQLMAHLEFLCDVHIGKTLGYIEDDELIAVLNRHRTELKSRLEDGANEVLQLTDTSTSGNTTLPSAVPAAGL